MRYLQDLKLRLVFLHPLIFGLRTERNNGESVYRDHEAYLCSGMKKINIFETKRALHSHAH